MQGCVHPAARRERLYGARDYVTGDRFELARCRDCGLVLTEPAPAAEAAARYYPAGYHGAGASRRFPGVAEWLQAAVWRRRAAAVERWVGGRGRVLDVGCGPGWVLGRFRERGWEVQGTEGSEEAARHARERLRLPVVVAGAGAAWPWPDRHFDAVILWHVLEHLPDPEGTLREVARVLRPGGVLLVGVPNFGSPEARLAADRWFHLDVPRHRVHFTRSVLRRALASAGFMVRRVSFFSPEYDAFSFTQSALNRLGLRQNLLYNRLRGAGAKVLGEAGGRGRLAQEILSLALAVPLGLLSLGWTLVAGLTGQGATLTLWAVREG
ncbi:MAG: hypothetical protein RJA22_952 [Verrucomicrobiota bacterium]